MNALSLETLAELIPPSGYFNVKAQRLKNFLAHLNREHDGSLNRLFRSKNRKRQNTGKAEHLRAELLSINGIGPETADSILLYAGGRAEFVVDAYTRRILSRHGLQSDTATYGELKEFFTSALVPDAALFNEYHALIVMTGKEYCRPRRQKCEECPLKLFL